MTRPPLDTIEIRMEMPKIDISICAPPDPPTKLEQAKYEEQVFKSIARHIGRELKNLSCDDWAGDAATERLTALHQTALEYYGSAVRRTRSEAGRVRHQK